MANRATAERRRAEALARWGVAPTIEDAATIVEGPVPADEAERAAWARALGTIAGDERWALAARAAVSWLLEAGEPEVAVRGVTAALRRSGGAGDVLALRDWWPLLRTALAARVGVGTLDDLVGAVLDHVAGAPVEERIGVLTPLRTLLGRAVLRLPAALALARLRQGEAVLPERPWTIERGALTGSAPGGRLEPPEQRTVSRALADPALRERLLGAGRHDDEAGRVLLLDGDTEAARAMIARWGVDPGSDVALLATIERRMHERGDLTRRDVTALLQHPDREFRLQASRLVGELPARVRGP